MVSKINKNSRFIFGLITGVLLSIIGVYATAKLSSSDVLYDNSKSGGSSSDVQGSLEELYQKTKDYKPCSSAVWEANNKYFTDAYIYNPSTCVTGDEDTCLRTDCYISSKKTCPVGTIIDYVVSGNSNKVRFHVMSDDGETVTMQSQKNIVYNIAWNSSGVNSQGPITILNALEEVTKSWTHVNSQTYTMGATVFKTNKWTGCTGFTVSTCTKNVYVLPERMGKARLLTAQEAFALGCTGFPAPNCPIWLHNYGPESTDYGGTVNDDNGSYWLATANPETTYSARHVWHGYIAGGSGTKKYGARAVVVVSK